MIKPGEIQQKANAIGVRDQQIEKDYILSWIGLQKSFHLSHADKIELKKISSPSENIKYATAQTNTTLK